MHGGAKQMGWGGAPRRKGLLPTRFSQASVPLERGRRASDRSVAQAPRRPTRRNLPGCARVNHLSLPLTSVYPGKGLFDKTRRLTIREGTPLSPGKRKNGKKKKKEEDSEVHFPLR